MKRKDKLARRSARAALKRLGKPETKYIGLSSTYLPGTGQVVIDVTRGAFGGSNGVLYKLDEMALVGAIENKRELAVIINNIGLLALSQLIGFTLGASLDEMPAALAKWAHIDIEELKKLAAEEAADDFSGVQHYSADVGRLSEDGNQAGEIASVPDAGGSGGAGGGSGEGQESVA